jgi:hypothetical protein
MQALTRRDDIDADVAISKSNAVHSAMLCEHETPMSAAESNELATIHDIICGISNGRHTEQYGYNPDSAAEQLALA